MISHSLKLYNVVFYLFVATLIIITISIIEIYSTFKGKNIGSFEIEAYINYILESDASFSKKENIFKNFVSDWKEIIVSQDRQSYEKYFEIFEKCMVVLWRCGTEQSIVSALQQRYRISYCLLGSEKNSSRKRNEIYRKHM